MSEEDIRARLDAARDGPAKLHDVEWMAAWDAFHAHALTDMAGLLAKLDAVREALDADEAPHLSFYFRVRAILEDK